MIQYKIHQWYESSSDRNYYYYFWAIINNRLLGAEYDKYGKVLFIGYFEDEEEDEFILSKKVKFDKWADNKQNMMKELIKELWGEY